MLIFILCVKIVSYYNRKNSYEDPTKDNDEFPLIMQML